MQQQWYIKQGDQTLGPFGLADVYEFISINAVGAETWFGADGSWLDVDTLRKQWPDPRGSAPPPLPPPPPPLQSDQAVEVELLPAGPETSGSAKPPDFSAVTQAAEEVAPAIERDAILVLGRRRAGKTIYLATLYSMLWKKIGGLTMKALSGPAHTMLMSVMDQLRHGQWPEATLGTRQLEFELTYKRRKRLLVAFDYSGEDFRRAFVDDDTDSAEVKKLLRYVDRAAAVILLIDPAVVVSGKQDEVTDDDFGMVQAVERIRNWHGGSDVPVVIALTKADRNKGLIRSDGDAREFVLRHYSALARTLGRVAIFEVCAVQERRAGEGRTCPRRDSIPINIDKPLRYCLCVLRDGERHEEEEAARQAADAARREQERLEQNAIARSNRRLWTLVTGIIVLGLCGCAALYMVLINRR